MLDDLPSATAIARTTEHLLRLANADGRLPTPVDELVAAAGLVEPKESLLSETLLQQAPHSNKHRAAYATCVYSNSVPSSAQTRRPMSMTGWLREMFKMVAS